MTETQVYLSGKDAAWAAQLKEALEKAGVVCFQRLSGGDSQPGEWQRILRKCDYILMLLAQDSVDSLFDRSTYIYKEVCANRVSRTHVDFGANSMFYVPFI